MIALISVISIINIAALVKISSMEKDVKNLNK